MAGEPEAVPQRGREQPRAGGRAHHGERRQRQRDRARPGPLADDDVDAEVLHRDVQQLLGRAGEPVDLVEEEHLALLQGGQHGREVTRVLDGRSGRQPQGAPSSAAMIIASVVLPSPGGPDSSTWSGACPRPRAASSTSESWSRTTR